MLGLLTGLATIENITNIDETEKIPVSYIGDNISLVNAVNKDSARKACPHLWYQFNYFEKLFSIDAIHIHRDTNDLHNECDIHSSQLREMILDYNNNL
jgi:hypothetical protein